MLPENGSGTKGLQGLRKKKLKGTPEAKESTRESRKAPVESWLSAVKVGSVPALAEKEKTNGLVVPPKKNVDSMSETSAQWCIFHGTPSVSRTAGTKPRLQHINRQTAKCPGGANKLEI